MQSVTITSNSTVFNDATIQQSARNNTCEDRATKNREKRLCIPLRWSENSGGKVTQTNQTAGHEKALRGASPVIPGRGVRCVKWNWNWAGFSPWSLGSCDEVRTSQWRGSQRCEGVHYIKPAVLPYIWEESKYLPTFWDKTIPTGIPLCWRTILVFLPFSNPSSFTHLHQKGTIWRLTYFQL